MKGKWRLVLACLLPMAALIVLVTQLARMVDGLFAATVPPLFAVGVAALCGNVIRRKSREGKEDES